VCLDARFGIEERSFVAAGAPLDDGQVRFGRKDYTARRTGSDYASALRAAFGRICGNFELMGVPGVKAFRINVEAVNS
jgi:hypothetical protein